MLDGSENLMYVPYGFVKLLEQIVQNDSKKTKGISKGFSPVVAFDKALEVLPQRIARAKDYHVRLTGFVVASSGRLLPSQEDAGPVPSAVSLLGWLGLPRILYRRVAGNGFHDFKVFAKCVEPED
ncbi:MAG: hypothetical protein Q9171_004917 [Xanthocarpia ochracea]